MKNNPTYLLLQIVFMLTLIQGCTSNERDPARPNVLFIMVDDLNDWIGPLGGNSQAITPNLQKLASQSISFSNAHSNCPACQPSRNSLMSGLMPSTTGWYSNTFGKGLKRPVYDYIQERSISLPLYFRQNGYYTLGGGKLYHSGVAEYEEDAEKFWDETAPEYTISSYFMDTVGDGYGSPMYHPFPRGGSPINRKYGKKIPGFSLCGGSLDREKDIPGGVMHDEHIAGWAVKKLGENRTSPFFLAVGFVRPHVPFTAPSEYFDLYSDREIQIPEVPDDDLQDIPIYGKAMIPSILPMGDHYTVLDMGPEYWGDLVKSYLACVSFVDAQIGKVLQALEESPYSENTIVILCSDHGQHLGEKKHWRKMALWEEATRVPLIFRIPGNPNKGEKSHRPVGLIDVYPTLVEICGLPPNPGLEGRSLARLLEEPEMTWKDPVVQVWMYDNYAVRSEHFRYIRYRDGGEELYDHRSDPNEWYNLAGDPAFQKIIDELAGYIPTEKAMPFQSDSIQDDELENNIRKWKKNGIPDWLK